MRDARQLARFDWLGITACDGEARIGSHSTSITALHTHDQVADKLHEIIVTFDHGGIVPPT